MDLRLKGKSVLITGGSKGIGLACAKSFAAEGCRIHIASRDRERLQKAKAEIKGEVSTHAVDLRDGAALRALAAACAGVDVLVNNAGDILGVHPPATRTDRILAVMKAAAKAKFGDESRYEELKGTGSFGNMIEPEQVGDTVAFLASPRAGQLSGVMLNLGA